MNAKEQIQNAPKRCAKIGDRLHIHVGEETFKALDSKIKKGLARGETVTEKGIETWIGEFELHDKTKTGSAAYTWRGDKVKVERFFFTRRNGQTEKKSIGYAWRTL